MIAIFLMASCGEKSNEESSEKSILKTEIVEKEEKQKIKALLREYQKSLNTSDAKLV